ncbi:MAG: Mth938-like domain-containing protein [Ectothiorhodospiraceae bacterium]|nr:Mth938-like domain-containing protein [Ectothiorhodospiraceae bacterium]MCH8505428.1 Mth938-like domain-containing protein [Ectothiorhodospiraceae bacterium]
MQLTMENTGEANRIRSYGVGQVIVNDQVCTGTTVVARDTLWTDWNPSSPAELGVADLDALLELAPEIVLIGTGERQHFPDRALMVRAVQAGIGIEAMTTEAACRTYNVLIAEDRRVVAALFMIQERD